MTPIFRQRMNVLGDVRCGLMCHFPLSFSCHASWALSLLSPYELDRPPFISAGPLHFFARGENLEIFWDNFDIRPNKGSSTCVGIPLTFRLDHHDLAEKLYQTDVDTCSESYSTQLKNTDLQILLQGDVGVIRRCWLGAG